ncbi:MAG: hypothetical protein JXR26_05505 [Balneolaceae bacterium]|nr:hypothetical protein [Balneolaceae bacterium]
MTKFLGVYRGAAMYEIEEFEASKGQKVGTKILAKAMPPDTENLKIDFVAEASNQKEALRKIKKEINRFLDEHNMDEFIIASL